LFIANTKVTLVYAKFLSYWDAPKMIVCSPSAEIRSVSTRMLALLSQTISDS